MNTEKHTYKAWIEAFQIFDKYTPDDTYVVNPEHDVVYTGCNPELVSDEDKKRLKELGFHPSDTGLDCFYIFT